MRITIDTEHRTIQANNDPTQNYEYSLGSPMATAIRLVEKLLKIHIKTRAQADYITERTR